MAALRTTLTQTHLSLPVFSYPPIHSLLRSLITILNNSATATTTTTTNNAGEEGNNGNTISNGIVAAAGTPPPLPPPVLAMSGHKSPATTTNNNNNAVGTLTPRLDGARTPEIEVSSPSADSDDGRHHHLQPQAVASTLQQPAPEVESPQPLPAADVSSPQPKKSEEEGVSLPPFICPHIVIAPTPTNQPTVVLHVPASPQSQQQPQQQQPSHPQPNPSAAPTGGRTAARGGPSTYRGVVWHKSNSKWEARIYEGGKQKFLGYFTNEDVAAMAYDDYAAKIHGNAAKLNFPERYAGVDLPAPMHPPPNARQQSSRANGGGGGGGRARTTTPPLHHHAVPVSSSHQYYTNHTNGRSRGGGNGGTCGAGGRVQPVKGSSRFRGVSWNSNCSKWRAQVWKGSEVHHLGYFEHEEDAARAYDEAVLRIRGPGAPTNYPRTQYGVTVTGSEDGGVVGTKRVRRDGMMSGDDEEDGDEDGDDEGGSESHLLGVSWSDARAAWVSEIWDGRKYRVLGLFDTEQEAGRVYDVACLAQHGVNALINYPLSNYETELAASTLKGMSMDWEGAQELPWVGGGAGDTTTIAPAAAATTTTTTTTIRDGDNPDDKEQAAKEMIREVDATPPPQQTNNNNNGGQASRYLGVSWDRRKQRWFSQIQIRGNRKFLGYFDDEISAAKAHDAAAIKHAHGPFATALNFPSTGSATTNGKDQHKNLLIGRQGSVQDEAEVVVNGDGGGAVVPTAGTNTGALSTPLAVKLAEMVAAQQRHQQELRQVPSSAAAAAALIPQQQQQLQQQFQEQVLLAILARQQQEAAVAAFEKQYAAAQQRMVLAAAIDQLNQQAQQQQSLKRSNYEAFSGPLPPHTATTTASTPSAYQQAATATLAAWAATAAAAIAANEKRQRTF